MSFLLSSTAPTFAAALRDVRAKGRDARIAAAERLARADESELSEAVKALCVVSGDAEAIVRAAGIRGLGELAADHGAVLANDAELTRALAERLTDRSPLVREVATIALGQLGGAQAHRSLEGALQSEHPEVRFQAIAGYAETSESAEPRKLTPFLSDADAEVRGQAARALGALAAVAPKTQALVIAALKAVLGDTSPRTRAEAALALAKLGDASGGDVLGAALEDPLLRSEVLDAIATLSLTRYGDVIARIARNVFTSPFDRVALARALFRLGDGRGVELLRAALAGFRATPRVLAVHAIGELGASELAADVAKLAERPRGVDATTLIEALGALAGQSGEARAALERLAGRSGRAAELAAAELSRLSAPSPADPR